MQKVGGATLQHYYQELHEVIKTHARVIVTRCLIQTGQEREKMSIKGKLLGGGAFI